MPHQLLALVAVYSLGSDKIFIMLKKVRQKKTQFTGGKFAIVASQYNGKYVDAMLRAAKAEILRAGGTAQIVRVPGAYEIPVVAARLARDVEQCRGFPVAGNDPHVIFRA